MRESSFNQLLLDIYEKANLKPIYWRLGSNLDEQLPGVRPRKKYCGVIYHLY